MLYHYGWLSGHRKAVYLESYDDQLHYQRLLGEMCEDAIQIHGGYGYMTEYEIERELRDAIASKLYSGTSEIQRSIVSLDAGAVMQRLPADEVLVPFKSVPDPKRRYRRGRSDLDA